MESMQVKTVDASLGLADLFAVKDATELAHVRKAAQFTSHVLKQFLLPQIENVIGACATGRQELRRVGRVT